MGKQSKKDKCKRISLKQKSKVLKKVKLHHKKKAKEARNVAPKNKAKVERDADIPDEPQQKKFDEAKRARAAEDMQHKKAAIIVRGQKRKLGLLEDDDMDEPNFGTGRIKDDSTGFSKIRDNSERAFYKELAKVIEASDVILEVLDARDPLGTRCADVEKMVIRAGPDKHLVLLLNKIDLVPREAAEKWLKYLREELPTVAFKCSTQEQRSHLGWKSSSKSSKSAKNAKPGSILQTSDCLGAETLIKLLKNYSRSHEIKKSITVGVVGLPNVGKSSLINSMKRSHVVNVGATPGLTRSMQEVQLDKNVKLLDCPGVVMQRSSESDASIALRNCKRIEKLEDPVGPVKEILNLCTTKMLAALYKLSDFDNVDDFLQKVAISRGRLKKGGIVDINAAAKIVLRDWNEGKIPYYTMPPNRNEGEHLEATIVSEFGKEFDVDEVYGTESSFIGSLKSVDDFQTVDPNNSLGFNQAMQEDDVKEEPSNRGDRSDTKIEGNDDDVSMDQKSDTVETRAKTATSRQNEKLYGLDGMLNTKLRRAEKKRRRKERRSTTAAMEADDDDDINEDDDLDSKMDGDDQKMETATNDDALTKNKFELPVSAEELDS